MVERDINYKLIKEIEKYSMLYNFKLPEYSNKVVIEKAWNEIARKINITVADCKEKWRNVRSSFIRSRKAPPSGSKPKKPYYLAEYLGFILPYVKPIQSATDPGNIPAREVESQQVLENDNQSQHLEDEHEVHSDQDDNVEVTNGNAENTSHSFAEPSTACHSMGRIRKRPISEVDKTLVEYLKKKEKSKDTRKETQNAPPTHPMQHFFLSLLGEFDTMTESQTRHFKIRVLQLIDEIKSNTLTPTSPFGITASPEPSYVTLRPSPASQSTSQSTFSYQINSQFSPISPANSPGENTHTQAPLSCITVPWRNNNTEQTTDRMEDTMDQYN